MTTFQILALISLACALAGTYGPWVIGRLPKAKASSQLLAHIEAVVNVRDAYPDADVKAACNAVLSALLKVQG